MADLNALIAQGAQFQAPVDPFVQYGRMQQLEQGQQANQLNRMKMEEAQAAAVERNALRGLDPTSPDYESQLFRVNPTMGIAYRKERTAAEAQQATQERQNVDAAAARQGMLGQAYRDISSRPSDANITAHMEDVQASPLFKPDEVARVKQLGQTLLSMPFEQRGAFLASQGAKSSDLIVKPAPAPTSADATTMQALGYPLTPEGFNAFRAAQRTERLLTPEQEAQKTRIALASRPPGAPRPEQPPVAVIDPVTGAQIYVSREEALRGRMAPATGATNVKPLTEAQTIKLRTDVGKDYKNASTALSQIDDLLASATSVRTAPGLSAATGFTGMLPSFSEGAAAQAETRLANLRGKVTALGKATAAMGGAIGSIANQEWKILADQIAVLNEVKGKGPLLEQIALLEEQAKGASERIRDAYEKTRADDFERFPQFRDLPAPKAPSGKPIVSPNIDALLDKYLNKQK